VISRERGCGHLRVPRCGLHPWHCRVLLSHWSGCGGARTATGFVARHQAAVSPLAQEPDPEARIVRGISMTQSVFDNIRSRRSVRHFTDRPVRSEELELLLELAVTAPNHRMTQPWAFVILGPEARRAYGAVKGRIRGAGLADLAKAETLVRDTVSTMVQLPAAVAFIQRLDPDPTIREEDYATVYMGVQNFLVGAVAMGLAAHVRTGAALDDPETRAALEVLENERIVALVEVGEPASLPPVRPRIPARERTRHLP